MKQQFLSAAVLRRRASVRASVWLGLAAAWVWSSARLEPDAGRVCLLVRLEPGAMLASLPAWLGLAAARASSLVWLESDAFPVCASVRAAQDAVRVAASLAFAQRSAALDERLKRDLAYVRARRDVAAHCSSPLPSWTGQPGFPRPVPPRRRDRAPPPALASASWSWRRAGSRWPTEVILSAA